MSDNYVNKSQIIKGMVKSYDFLSESDATKVVDIVMEEISKGLEQKKRVEIRGFGAFSIRERDASKARNPKTNEVVNLGKISLPYFRPGKNLKQRVNN